MINCFCLSESQNISEVQDKIKALNSLLKEIGVSFKLRKTRNGNKLYVITREQKIKEVINPKVGRPIKYDFDMEQVKKMKAEGKTNKEIYESLGMSKSLFYLKMREYKNNIGL